MVKRLNDLQGKILINLFALLEVHSDRKCGCDFLEPKAREMHSLILSLSVSVEEGFHGVTVSTLDSESSNPSSNLGGTYKSFLSENPNLPLDSGCLVSTYLSGHRSWGPIIVL